MSAVADASPSWLCPEPGDRQRLLDMEQRIKPLRRVAFALLGVALLVLAPWLGLWPAAFLIVAASGFRLADRAAERRDTARPELWLFGAWVAAELVIAVPVALVDDPTSPTVSWLVLPIVTLPARFGLRGVALGTAIAAGLIVATLLQIDAGAVLADPPLLFAPLALLGAIAILSVALLDSDLHHRRASVLDGLTGMLNRRALEHRVRELEAQSALTGEDVAVIAGDLDRFKQVNDAHGHAVGDGVLVDVAYVLRKRLRAFDLAYRLGGEEFLVLLPGAGLLEARALAERLRADVAAARPGGLPVTMSFGVAASGGGSLDFDALMAAADAALYQAKAEGRDRVCVDGGAGVAGASVADQGPAAVPAGAEPAVPAR